MHCTVCTHIYISVLCPRPAWPWIGTVNTCHFFAQWCSLLWLCIIFAHIHKKHTALMLIYWYTLIHITQTVQNKILANINQINMSCQYGNMYGINIAKNGMSHFMWMCPVSCLVSTVMQYAMNDVIGHS